MNLFIVIQLERVFISRSHSLDELEVSHNAVVSGSTDYDLVGSIIIIIEFYRNTETNRLFELEPSLHFQLVFGYS